MSEKNLSESEWKKFSKGRGLKDTAFVKALAALEGGKTPDIRLKALDDIGKEADALRKANKANKEITAYLDDTDKAAARERKLVEAEAKKEAAKEAAKKDSSGDDEEESPALLTSKMIPLLREVKKGELTLQALIALAGKETVVLISRRAISPARGKLLKEQMTNPGGLKFIRGECLFEASAVTFVVQAAAGGLAKRIKAALLAQTDLRVKVRVRGEDPDDVEDDGEPAEPDEAAMASTAAPAATTSQEPSAPATPAAQEEPAADELQARFDARLNDLTPRVLAALQAQHPEAGKIRAIADFAREKGESRTYKAGLAALDQLEKFLAVAPAGSASSAAPAIGKVDYAKCRLAWEGARKKVHGELQKLEQAIVETYRGDPAFGEIALKVRKVDSVLSEFAEDLSGLLDQALNEPDPAERQRLHQDAALVIRKFLERAANDPFITELESNPFVPITARSTLVTTLGTLARLIA